MKNKLFKPAMAVALAGIVALGSIVPFSATVNETQTASESGNKEAEVVYTQDSNFIVTIPKKITLDETKSSTYNVNVIGDIASDEKITVVPDASFLMKDQATVGTLKADVTATVSQDKTEWTSPEIAVEGGSTTDGSVSAPDLTAGNWKGTFNFNINLDGTQTPVALEAGLYDAEGVMLCTWEESGIDASQDYSYTEGDENYWKTAETSGYSVLTNNYPNATKVVIPSSVTTIGVCSFQGCTGLTSVILPDSLTTINRGAFFKCTSLASVTFPDSVTSIGHDAFALCTSLTSVTIGDGVTTIEDTAFRECSSLTSVTIPDSVTSIGKCAFWECTGLTSVTFETTSGWYVGDSEGEKTTALSESDLADTSTASTYLTSTYCYNYWTR